jgi:hypothetical protein
MAIIIEELVAAGHGLKADELLAGIDHARLPVDPPQLTRELAREEFEADQAEDRAKAEYYWNPCRATWLTYRRALIAETFTNSQMIQAGDDMWGTP